MLSIRPTSIIAHLPTESKQTDLRQFSHSLNQQIITDTDCIIPITHKNQLTTVNRKDLSPGMSPWSAYHRDWLTGLELDLEYLRQGIGRYREVDDNGQLCLYWFKWSQDQLDHYNNLVSKFDTSLSCSKTGRYIKINSHHWFGTRTPSTSIHQALSKYLWLIICYGNIQQSNGTCTSIKCTLPITWYIRSQIAILEADILFLRQQWLFIQQYVTGTGMRQHIQLVCNDPEVLQIILLHLQHIDSTVTMTTFDTLRERSTQLIQWLDGDLVIAKPRTLD